MKTLVIKPIMWNDNGYTGPSGYRTHSGYSNKHGFGHEEWNNSPNRVWRGFRVFHTEASKKLQSFSDAGNLGILMMASHGGKQYAVGLATNVFQNTDEEMRTIAEELGLRGASEELWAVERVRKCFKGDKAAFMAHWEGNFAWLMWQCPEEQFFWFPDPVELDARAISGKGKLIGMHGRHQQVQPAKVLPILLGHMPSDHDCLQWLTDGEFDVPKGKVETTPTGEELRAKYRIARRNSTAGRKYDYWIEGRREVEPLHGRLQNRFVKFLEGQGIRCVQDHAFIDVRYRRDGREVFAEVKPTENVDTRYAVRAAVGQLLEYRFLNNPDARLEVVLSSERRPNEKAFLASLGIALIYLDAASGAFVTERDSG